MRVFHYVTQADGDRVRIVAYAFYRNYSLLHRADSVFVPDCYQDKCRVLSVRVREDKSGGVTMYVVLSPVAVRAKKAKSKKQVHYRAP